MSDWRCAWRLQAGLDWLLPPLIPALILVDMIHVNRVTPAHLYRNYEQFVPLLVPFLVSGLTVTGFENGMGELEATYRAVAWQRLWRGFLLAGGFFLAAAAGLTGLGALVQTGASPWVMIQTAGVPALVLGSLTLAAATVTRSSLIGTGLGLTYWGADAFHALDRAPWLHLFRYGRPIAGQLGDAGLIAVSLGVAALTLLLAHRRSWWVR